MLQIGDVVVYPMHGAGVIDKIERCEVCGEEKVYYVLRLPMGSMKVMIPVDNAENIGLRNVIGKEELSEVVEVLKSKPEKPGGSWNKRFQMNLDSMKTGDLKNVAKVARNLIRQDKNRRISSGEKRLMDLAKQILVSELVYASGKSLEEVDKWLDELLKSPVS
ncbi:MAG: CarD family transcriptional regulator [Selenomonadaceae bacterium]|nr:CarD family transcriptional regulator [Selenomonadaceae bacterium]